MATDRRPDRPLGHQFAMAWLNEGAPGAVRVASTANAADLLDVFMRVNEDTDDEPELAFLHSALCSMSLPARCPQDPTAPIIREDGKYALAIHPKPVLQLIDGKPQMRSLGVPYGSYPRVALIYILSEAVRRKSRDVYLGRNFTEWTRRLGYKTLSYGPRGTATRLKEQVDRLLACEWQIRWDDEQGEDSSFAFREVKLSNEYAGSMKAGDFSREIRLSEVFYNHLVEHAVPLNELAIRELKEKSIALDLYCYLAYRLPRVTRAGGQTISWEQLYRHMGSDCDELKSFKQNIRKALNLVTAVYPNANVDMSGSNLVKLFPSPAPDERRLVGPHLRLVGSSSAPTSSVQRVTQPALHLGGESKSSVRSTVAGEAKLIPPVAVRGFPSGTLQFGDERVQRFREAGRLHGGGWDVEMIAETYRKQFGEAMKNRSEADVMQSWIGFCKGWVQKRGPTN